MSSVPPLPPQNTGNRVSKSKQKSRTSKPKNAVSSEPVLSALQAAILKESKGIDVFSRRTLLPEVRKVNPALTDEVLSQEMKALSTAAPASKWVQLLDRPKTPENGERQRGQEFFLAHDVNKPVKSKLPEDKISNTFWLAAKGKPQEDIHNLIGVNNGTATKLYEQWANGKNGKAELFNRDHTYSDLTPFFKDSAGQARYSAEKMKTAFDSLASGNSLKYAIDETGISRPTLEAMVNLWKNKPTDMSSP